MLEKSCRILSKNFQSIQKIKSSRIHATCSRDSIVPKGISASRNFFEKIGAESA